MRNIDKHKKSAFTTQIIDVYRWGTGRYRRGKYDRRIDSPTSSWNDLQRERIIFEFNRMWCVKVPTGNSENCYANQTNLFDLFRCAKFDVWYWEHSWFRLFIQVLSIHYLWLQNCFSIVKWLFSFYLSAKTLHICQNYLQTISNFIP